VQGGGTSLYFNGGGMENDASATCSHVCSLVFSIMFTLVTSGKREGKDIKKSEWMLIFL
jgi:hypothetical protein